MAMPGKGKKLCRSLSALAALLAIINFYPRLRDANLRGICAHFLIDRRDCLYQCFLHLQHVTYGSFGPSLTV